MSNVSHYIGQDVFRIWLSLVSIFYLTTYSLFSFHFNLFFDVFSLFIFHLVS